MSEETLDRVRQAVTKDMETVLAEGHPDYSLTHSVTQSYLLLQILDMLDNINTKVAMMKIDIQDVEQEIAKLNPEYK
jgi:hypothetical protein